MVGMDWIGVALPPGWAWPAYLYLAGVGLAASWIDQTTGRIPNRLVLPSYPIVLGLLVWAAALGHDATALVRAALGGAGLFLVYLMLTWVAAGQLGMGDVKLAGLLGMGLAHVGWTALAVGALAGFALGGAAGLALLAQGKGARQAFPFGPWMCLGALLGGLFTLWTG